MLKTQGWSDVLNPLVGNDNGFIWDKTTNLLSLRTPEGTQMWYAQLCANFNKKKVNIADQLNFAVQMFNSFEAALDNEEDYDVGKDIKSFFAQDPELIKEILQCVQDATKFPKNFEEVFWRDRYITSDYYQKLANAGFQKETWTAPVVFLIDPTNYKNSKVLLSGYEEGFNILQAVCATRADRSTLPACAVSLEPKYSVIDRYTLKSMEKFQKSQKQTKKSLRVETNAPKVDYEQFWNSPSDD